MMEDDDPNQNPSGSNEGIPTKLSNIRFASLREHEEREICLGEDYELKPQDIICGARRGKQQEAMRHPGNERLRVLVELRIERYRQAADRREKTNIINEIVKAVQVSGGNFVRHNNGVWYEVSIMKAREKAGHALRYAVSKLTNPSGAAKRQRSAAPPSEMVHTRASVDPSSRQGPLSSSSNVAQLDRQFWWDEDIYPDPITPGGGRPPEPEGFREFVRLTFLRHVSSDQQGSTVHAERHGKSGQDVSSKEQDEEEDKKPAARR